MRPLPDAHAARKGVRTTHQLEPVLWGCGLPRLQHHARKAQRRHGHKYVGAQLPRQDRQRPQELRRGPLGKEVSRGMRVRICAQCLGGYTDLVCTAVTAVLLAGCSAPPPVQPRPYDYDAANAQRHVPFVYMVEGPHHWLFAVNRT